MCNEDGGYASRTGGPVRLGVIIPRTIGYQGRLDWKGRVEARRHGQALHYPETGAHGLGEGKGHGNRTIGLGEGGDIRVRERCVSSCLLGFSPGYLGVHPTAQELRKNRGEILGLPFWS